MSLPWANPCLSWGDCGNIADEVVVGAPTSGDWASTVATGDDAVKRYSPRRSFLGLSSDNTSLFSSNDNSVVDKSATNTTTAGSTTDNAAGENNITTTASTTEMRILGAKRGSILPYKVEHFERELFEHDPGDARREAVIRTLRSMGVKVYVIEQLSIKNVADLVQQIRSVVKWTREEASISEDALLLQSATGYSPRCLLYQDLHGRLFNLVFADTMRGPADRWREYMDSFSTSRAIVSLVILMRSLPCLLYRKCFWFADTFLARIGS